MPTALITGVTGQDESYLAEFLLRESYRVVGRVWRSKHLIVNPTSVWTHLGWTPRGNFEQLMQLLVDADIKLPESQHQSP